MEESPYQPDAIGLCASCQHVYPVRSDRGSMFYQCRRAADDPDFPRYPILPVRQCKGYEDPDPAPPRARTEPS